MASADLHHRLEHTVEQHRSGHGPEGADDGERRRRRSLDSGPRHAERQIVGPVEILSNQHHRRRPREHLECVGAPLDHGIAEILDVAIVGGSTQELAQLRSVRCRESLVGGERVGDIAGTAGDLVGGHFDHGHPSRPRRVGQ